MQPVSDPQEADLIFVYTCGGFNYYEKQSIQIIEKSLEIKSAKVIITGCLPKINPKILNGYRGTHILDPDDFEGIDEFVQANYPYEECDDCSIVEGVHGFCEDSLIKRIKRNLKPSTQTLAQWVNYIRQRVQHNFRFASFSLGSNKTYKLEIARGCLGNCSYCAIKRAMPKFNSHSEEKILERFQSGLQKNYRDFALIAGDIGCYGLDISKSLPSLLRRMLAIEGNYRILLVDLNPRWFVKYFSELIPILNANSKRVAGIVMPIQSGSDRILKLMNRHYASYEVMECIQNLLENIPDVDLRTHILVGFPGETDEDFRESLDFVKKIPFSDVQIYLYEDRPGTIASNLPNKVPKRVIKRRMGLLIKQLETQRKSVSFGVL